MSQTPDWITRFNEFANPAKMLEVLTGAGKDPAAHADTETPDAFFDELMTSLDFQSFTAKAYSALFAGGDEAGRLEATPRAALDYGIELIRQTGELPPSPVLEAMAEGAMKMGRHECGEICAGVAYLTGSRGVVTLCILAGMAVREGRPDEAADLADQAAAVAPDRPEPIFYRALAGLLRGDTRAAEEHLRAACTGRPKYRQAWILLADLLLSGDRPGEALATVSEAIRHHPYDLVLWDRKVTCLERLGRAGEALEAATQALEISGKTTGLPPEARWLLHLKAAHLEERCGAPEAALARYRALLSWGADAAAVFVNAAACLERLGKTDDALSLLETGLGRHPREPAILANYGELLFLAKRYDEAVSCLEQALEADPGRTHLLLLIGAAHLARSRWEAAANAAHRLLSADASKAVEALVLAGDAHRFRGALGPAKQLYTEALSRAPGNAEIRERLAMVESPPPET